MGYRIEYGDRAAVRKERKGRSLLTRIVTVACILSLVAGALAVKHAGLTWVTDFLLPGDPAVTAAALENMVESIREGEPWGDAVTAFCREIIENAE